MEKKEKSLYYFKINLKVSKDEFQEKLKKEKKVVQNLKKQVFTDVDCTKQRIEENKVIILTIRKVTHFLSVFEKIRFC